MPTIGPRIRRAAALRAKLLRSDPAAMSQLPRGRGRRLARPAGDGRTPTLVIAGARDVGATPEMAQAIAERIPGAELAVIEDASHLSVAEQPEAFAELVQRFLAELPAEPAEQTTRRQKKRRGETMKKNADDTPSRFGSGRAIPRVEDGELLVGRGRFVDNVAGAGAATLAFQRSPHAHARIVAIDADAARALPGVLAVDTGAELAAAGIQPMATTPTSGAPTAAPPSPRCGAPRA